MEKQINKEVIDRINALPLDPEYKQDLEVPIPLGKGVLVKKISQTPLAVLDSGIILMEGNNSNPPKIGIIQAVGPDCSPYLRVGLRCYYNFYVDTHFRMGGIDYAKMHEQDVFYIVPPKAIVFETVKSDKQVRQEKKVPEMFAREARLDARDENEKDMRLDKTRGKIRKVK
jgi:co-chaperonin GroES (HSP10)